MKTLTVKTTGQYSSSNSIFTGTKKQVRTYLRSEASRMRRESRLVKKLDDTVHAIDSNLHISKLVTMASFTLGTLGIESLLELLNNHGVLKYTVS